MKIFGVIFCLFMLFFVPMAQAGFEWMPPAQNPTQTQQALQAYQQPTAMMPESHNYASGGFPAAPVEVQPLAAGQDPMSIMPESYQHHIPPQQGRNLSGSQGGLKIDPYPLRRAEGQNHPMNLSEESVQQAMAEEAHILNPLKLGAGLKTGTPPRPVQIPSASVQRSQIPRGPIEAMGQNTGRLTPMMDGEPAPLPGLANAMRNQIQPPRRAIMNYAEAVGFGRELPLSLAISQVIPSDFMHSYAAEVDTQTIVSWEGGKPWNEVLNDMLRPQNLSAIIQGNQVIIQPMARL